jgi:hypothetical protein
VKELPHKITVFGAKESGGPAGFCDVLCTAEGFDEVVQAISEHLDHESAKNLLARTGDDCRTIGIHRVPQRPNPDPPRWRDQIALFGCAVACIVAFAIASGCFTLMGIGFGVVMGWLEKGP